MKKWQFTSEVLFSFIVLMLFQTYTIEAGVKKIAVLDFDASAISAKRGNGNVGRAVSDIIVTELVKDGTFKVVERNQLEKILSEQKLSMSGMVDPNAVARIGKVLGVSAVIVGSVTQFNVEQKTIGILMVGAKKNTASVAINARMIDTSTAEILFAAEGKGEEEAYGVAVGGYLNVDSTKFADSILGTATKKALQDVVKQIVGQSAKLTDATINAKLAYVDQVNKTVIFDAGKETGVEKEDIFSVIKVVKEITSPTTGAVIKRITEKIADFKVIEVDKSSATATLISGKCADVKEGDEIILSQRIDKGENNKINSEKEIDKKKEETKQDSTAPPQ